jgi:hypothetical protein
MLAGWASNVLIAIIAVFIGVGICAFFVGADTDETRPFHEDDER